MWGLMKIGFLEPKMSAIAGSMPFHTVVDMKAFRVSPDNRVPELRDYMGSYSQTKVVRDDPKPEDPVVTGTEHPKMNYPKVLCKKKKRRRRRRRRKQQKNGNIAICASHPCARGRHLSEESEDSVVCFMEDPELSDDDIVFTQDIYSSESSISSKKVRFAESLCQVHTMVMWSFAYQVARKGPWEEYARDRERFRFRIIKTEREIGQVFSTQHRARIFEERFA